jgi:Pyridoxamine 5'-phosphate oxidase
VVQPPVVNKVYVVDKCYSAISVQLNEPFATSPAPPLFDHHWFPLNCRERAAMSSSFIRKHASTARRVTNPRCPSLCLPSGRALWCTWDASEASRPFGFPFGSVMPYGLDEHGRPIFLISTMAMHTHNLQADSRASLLVTQPEASGDPLGASRCV